MLLGLAMPLMTGSLWEGGLAGVAASWALSASPELLLSTQTKARETPRFRSLGKRRKELCVVSPVAFTPKPASHKTVPLYVGGWTPQNAG